MTFKSGPILRLASLYLFLSRTSSFRLFRRIFPLLLLRYIYIKTSNHSMTNVLWDVLEPGLKKIGYNPPDPTYGRYTLPVWEPEARLDADPTLHVVQRRLFIPASAPPESVEIEFAEDVKCTEEELSKERRRGGRWVYYKTYEKKTVDGPEAFGRDIDMVYIHGLNEYGTRFACHASHFLDKGFRVILPDLPSFGRSTGVHSNLTHPHLLTAAVHATLQDVVKQDLANGKKQKEVFMSGASMGGWTTLYYLITYPPTTKPEKIETSVQAEEGKVARANENQHGKKEEKLDPQNEYRPKIAGAFALCPLVEVAASSRPHALVEAVARGIVKFAPSLPLAEAVRGNVSDDPRVELEFMKDPLTYHGKLRASTGMSLLQGFTELGQKAELIDIPIRIIHGNHDRATSHLATEKFWERIPNKDKEIGIYEGYEHVMMKVGINEEDDEKRQRVIIDWLGWLQKRVAIDRESGQA